jgi:hypothetical protein
MLVILLVLHTLKLQHEHQLTATLPGQHRCSFLFPTADIADALAAFVANCLTEALSHKTFSCLLCSSHNKGTVVLRWHADNEQTIFQS